MIYAKANFLEKTFKDDSEYYRFIVTKNNIDRVGDRIIVAGIDTSEYLLNPIILFNHNAEKPIGFSTLSYNDDMTEMYADAYFDEVTELSKNVKQMIEKGTLRTVSIGLQVIEWNDREPTAEEKAVLSTRPYIKIISDITKSIMLEWSVAPLPMNPLAYRTRAIQKGLDLKEFEIYNNEIMNIEKGGAVLSKTNKEKLLEASNLISEVITASEKETDKNLSDDIDAKTKFLELFKEYIR